MTLLELREKLRTEYGADWRIAIEAGLIQIRTKDRRLTPLVPNAIQRRYMDRIWETMQRGEAVRILVPKARQHGISTMTEAIIYSIAAFQDNISAIIVADTKEHARKIFQMSKLMHEKMDGNLRTETKKSNAAELSFSENHSEIVISTDARSGTFHIFHSSETAFYKTPENTMLGVLQTVPDGQGTIVVMESTGNGIGNYFYQRCMEAKAGTSDYVLFFIPWHENPEYSRPLGPTQELIPQESGPYGNEVRDQKAHNLTLEQLNWRRYTIINKCGKDLQKFMQEYPATLDECFQASGAPVFDQILLNDIQLQAQTPTWRGSIKDKEITITKAETRGWLQVWQKPVPGWRNRYVVGADTGGVWEGADYSVAYVYDRMTRENVACIHGHFDAFEFARMLVTLSKWYCNAKLAIEVNSWESEVDDMGNTVIDRIITEIRYKNLYRRKAMDEETKKVTRKVGWNTNRETKQMLVDRLRQFTLEQHDFPITYNEYSLIEEMKTYVIDQTATGKTTWNAQDGCHDDRLIAFGICLLVAKEMPAPSLIPKTEPHKPQSLIEAVA